jgi:DNA modification methylase
VLLIEDWPIDRPIDYPKNARKWSEASLKKFGKSIAEFGWRQPLVVDSEGVIVIGHFRRAAGKLAGFTTCPVHIATDLSPLKIRKLRLADNRLHEEANWDLEILTVELAELQALDLDLSITGFGPSEIDRMGGAKPGKTDPDAIPPLPAVPVAATGDVWLMEGHRLTCGDCTKPDVVARVLGDRKPALMVTDPPYGISLDSEWRDRAGLNTAPGQKRTAASKAAAKENPEFPAEPSYMKQRTEGHSETTISGDTKADWSDAFELVPSLQVAYVWHASIYTREVLNGLIRIGFLYPQQIIWNKGRVVLTRTHYWYQHEPCWYVRKVNAPWFGKPGENSTVWDASSPKFIMGGSKDPVDVKQNHPTQKPAVLMRKSIINHTQAGEYVYEPFGGSGTTLLACEQTGRLVLSCELDPKYVDVDVQRWQDFTGKEATLEGDGRTFAQVKAERVAVGV